MSLQATKLLRLKPSWPVFIGISIALGLMVLVFITANAWLIACIVIGLVISLFAYLFSPQKNSTSSAQPENIIPLIAPGCSTETSSTQIKSTEVLTSVLVVEDNPVAMKTLSKLFSTLGAQTVTEASNAEEALELIKTRKFTFILTDYQLGGMTGVQLLERIRGIGIQTPLIILSATPDQTGVLRAASFNHTDFFGKPLRKRELVSAIDRLANTAV